MSDQYFLCLDLGTTSVKTGLFNEQGTLKDYTERTIRTYYPRIGLAEQAPEELCHIVLANIRHIITMAHINPQNIAAVCIVGQMGAILGIDKNWKDITCIATPLDTSAVPYLNLIMKNGNRVIELTGAVPTHSPKILQWKQEHPDVFKRIEKFVVPSTYVVGMLADLRCQDAFIDRTYLYLSGLSDSERGVWSDELCSAFGIPNCKLPQIVEPWAKVGYLSKNLALDSGLVAGTPIIAGAGDASATCLGAGIIKPGQMFDISGTACILGTCIDRFLPDKDNKNLWMLGSVIPNYWYPIAVTFGGRSHRWFIDTFCKEEIREAEIQQCTVYSILDQQAKGTPPGSHSLIFLPHLGGKLCPPSPNARGSWIGFNWAHKKSDFYRSILESIAYEFNIYLEIIKKHCSIKIPKDITIVGGGANSKLWNQIKADVLGIPYLTINRHPASLFGAFIIAGYAVGLFDDILKAGLEPIEIKDRILPLDSNHRLYKKYTEPYATLIPMTNMIFDNMDKVDIGELSNDL